MSISQLTHPHKLRFAFLFAPSYASTGKKKCIQYRRYDEMVYSSNSGNIISINTRLNLNQDEVTKEFENRRYKRLGNAIALFILSFSIGFFY
jgi:hypothetical protein